MHLPWCIKYSQTDRDCARHAGEDTLEGGREAIPGKSRATASVAVCSYSASGGARVYGFIPPEHSEGEVVVVWQKKDELMTMTAQLELVRNQDNAG